MVVAGLILLARARVELVEAEVALGDEGARATRRGERQDLAIMSLSAFRIEPVAMPPNRRSARAASPLSRGTDSSARSPRRRASSQEKATEKIDDGQCR
jgi:hypothetical protein